MIKELFYNTKEDNLKFLPVDSTLLDDWDTVVRICKEKLNNGLNKVYIYSALVTIFEETTKRKISNKYDCSFWKSTKEIKLDERWEVDSESIQQEKFKKIDL